MQVVLSKEQAKAITGGRTPLVPVEYEAAVNALQKCQSIDDTKYWSDKADALAAWAKIYRNDQAGREAKKLKLHAYRKMGELAEALRPVKRLGRAADGQYQGSCPGPQSLLREHGFSVGTVGVIRRLAKAKPEVFNAAINAANPPSPTRFVNSVRNCSETWKLLAGMEGGASLTAFRCFCRKYSSRDLAQALAPDERNKAKAMAEECAEWLDAFIQCLPK